MGMPHYYFRSRDNGAAVFRVENDLRMKRMELVEIAFVNVKTGNLRAHGEASLTEADRAAIEDWLITRRSELAAREADDARRLLDQIGQTTQWVQSRADDAVLDQVSDQLLLAMHDLKAALVRKMAERALARQAGS